MAKFLRFEEGLLINVSDIKSFETRYNEFQCSLYINLRHESESIVIDDDAWECLESVIAALELIQDKRLNLTVLAVPNIKEEFVAGFKAKVIAENTIPVRPYDGI